jgi:hypothetical protein
LIQTSQSNVEYLRSKAIRAGVSVVQSIVVDEVGTHLISKNSMKNFETLPDQYS